MNVQAVKPDRAPRVTRAMIAGKVDELRDAVRAGCVKSDLNARLDTIRGLVEAL